MNECARARPAAYRMHGRAVWMGRVRVCGGACVEALVDVAGVAGQRHPGYPSPGFCASVPSAPRVPPPSYVPLPSTGSLVRTVHRTESNHVSTFRKHPKRF